MGKPKLNYIAAMMIFGSIGVFARNINASSSQIALIRGIIGSIFLFIVSFLIKQKISWKSIKPNLLLLLITGAGIGFNWIFLFQAYKYTTISNATLSYYCAPVFVMFLSPVILKERLTVVKSACIIAAMAGMFLIVGNGESAASKSNMAGIGYGLIAAVLYSGVILVNKFIKGLSGLESTFMQLGIASLVLLPYVLFTDRVKLANINSKTVVLILFIGIVHTGFAYYLYISSMQKLKGQTVAVFSYIDPIIAIFLSGIVLGEPMTLLQIFGGALILGSTFASEIIWGKKE